MRTDMTVRHAHTARVQDAHVIHRAIELHVSMTAHDDLLLHALNHRPDAIVSRTYREDLIVAPRCRVTEEYVADSLDTQRQRLRQRGKKVTVFAAELAGCPFHEVPHV